MDLHHLERIDAPWTDYFCPERKTLAEVEVRAVGEVEVAMRAEPRKNVDHVESLSDRRICSGVFHLPVLWQELADQDLGMVLPWWTCSRSSPSRPSSS